MNKPKPAGNPDTGASHVPDKSNPRDPGHDEWVIDEGSDESFPASDPSEATMPRPRPARKER